MWGDLPKKNESNTNSDFDRMAGAGLVGAIVCVIALFIAKFIPIALVGASFGFFIYTARFQTEPSLQLKTALRNIALIGILFFIGFGFPIRAQNGWAGALFYSKDFWDTCIQIAREWNGVLPHQKVFNSLRLLEISPLMVTRYAWLSVYAALGFAALYFILGVFGKVKSEASEISAKILALPSLLVKNLEGIVFHFWIQLGRVAKKEIILLMGGCLIAAVYGLKTYVIPQLEIFEFKWLATYAVDAPLFGLSLGLILSRSQLGSGFMDLAWDHSKSAKPDRQSGFSLGKKFRGGAFRLTERNLNYHVEIVAPTGSGKTNLLKGLISDRIQKGHGVIFLDFKAEFEIVSWMFRTARSVNRQNEMRLFSLSNGELSVPYNPIKYGDATDIHSALMNAMTWSESFYRGVASVALMTLVKSLCEYRDKTGELFHLGHLYTLLDQPGLMRGLADRMAELRCPMAPKLSELASRVEKPSERSNLMGLISNLNQLLFSSAGELLSQDTEHGSFDFREAISQGRIVTLLMNSLKLKESAQIVGKMILQDLMSFVGDHYAQIDPSQHRPLTLIIDEFAAFATPNFIEFMDRARGAGIGIVIAHQARADLRAISPEFQERVEANSNTSLISGLNSSADAEHYAGMLGTKTTKKETVQKKQGMFWDDETGMKSVRDVEEFILHPNRLKELGQGEVFAISRTVDPKWGLVKVAKAKEFAEFETDSESLISHLKSIRAEYQSAQKDQYLDLSSLLAKKPGLKTELPKPKANPQSETWK